MGEEKMEVKNYEGLFRKLEELKEKKVEFFDEVSKNLEVWIRELERIYESGFLFDSEKEKIKLGRILESLKNDLSELNSLISSIEKSRRQ